MPCKHTINKHVTWNLQQKKERSGTGSIDPRAPTKSHPTPGGGGVGHPPTLKFCQTHPPPPGVGRTLSKSLACTLNFRDILYQLSEPCPPMPCSTHLDWKMEPLALANKPTRPPNIWPKESMHPPPPPLFCPAPGKTVPRQPRGGRLPSDGPPPHPGEPHYHHTRTFSGTEIALQNERIHGQDCLAFMLIRDAAICITVLSEYPTTCAKTGVERMKITFVPGVNMVCCQVPFQQK